MLSVMVSVMFLLTGDFGVVASIAATVGGVAVLSGRASLFEAALPIDARKITHARLMVALVLALTPLAFWFAALRFFRLAQMVEEMVPELLGTRAPTAVDRSSLCAVVVIAAVLPIGLRVRDLGSPPASLLLASYATLIGLSALVLLFLPMYVAFVLSTLAAIGILWWTVMMAPESFQLTSLRLEGAAAQSTSRGATTTGDSAKWRLAVARSLPTPQWAVVAGLLLMQSYFGNWIWFVGLTLVSVPLLRQKSAWFSTLPLSSRARLMTTFVPVMMGTVVPIAVGSWLEIPGSPFSHMNPLSWQAPNTPYEKGHYYDSPTRIKLVYWQVAPNGKGPLIISPTGESIEPYTLSVPGFVMYSPYTTNRQSSKEFITWQYARASTKVYGHPVPMPESYEEGKIFPPPLIGALRVRILFASAVASFVLLMYLTVELAQYRSTARGPRTLKPIWTSFPAIPVIICVLIDGFYGARRLTQIVVPLSERLLLQLSNALPDSLIVVLLVAVVPVAALYPLIEWVFARTEMVPVIIAKKP